MLLRNVSLILAGLMFSVIATAQEGYYFKFPYSVRDTVYQSVRYHRKLRNGDVVYLHNRINLKNPGDEEARTYLVRSGTDGEIVWKHDMGNDSLRIMCAYGDNAGENIQTYSFARSAQDRVYMIYRLYDPSLEILQSKIFYIDTFSKSLYIELYDFFDQLRTKGKDKIYNIFVCWSFSESLGMVFDEEGYLEKIRWMDQVILKPLEKDVLLYDNSLDYLYMISHHTRYTIDTVLNLVRKEEFPSQWPIKNDTIFNVWNSVVQVDGKIIRMGKTILTYNEDKPDEAYAIYGRGISEIDYRMRVRGKLSLTELPMTDISDGAPRLSNGLFYRDGYYYTLFEYQDYAQPFPSPNTICVAKYDTLLNIVEETRYVVSDHYYLFMFWVDLSEDLQFSLSGFMVNTAPVPPTNDTGAYVLGLNADGSLPPMSTRSDLIRAVFKVRGNPTSDYLTLSTSEAASRNYEVRIYDIDGRLIRMDKDWHDGEIRIPVHAQLPGTYIYQVWETGRPLISGKFVKL